MADLVLDKDVRNWVLLPLTLAILLLMLIRQYATTVSFDLTNQDRLYSGSNSLDCTCTGIHCLSYIMQTERKEIALYAAAVLYRCSSHRHQVPRNQIFQK